jgi:hypothetical protein
MAAVLASSTAFEGGAGSGVAVALSAAVFDDVFSGAALSRQPATEKMAATRSEDPSSLFDIAMIASRLLSGANGHIPRADQDHQRNLHTR